MRGRDGPPGLQALELRKANNDTKLAISSQQLHLNLAQSFKQAALLILTETISSPLSECRLNGNAL